MNSQNSVLRVIVWLGVACVSFAANAQSSKFAFELKDGSMITATVKSSEFEWTTVLEDGEMTSRQVRLTDLKYLSTTDEPASERVAMIRKSLSDLNSADWNLREAAEAHLSKKEVGGAYKRLIERYAENEEFEVKYRINRILNELQTPANSSNATNARFDRLILQDGQSFEGEATNLNLLCEYAGKEITLTREHVRRVNLPTNEAAHAQIESDSSIEMIHSHDEFFEDGKIKGDRTLVDFENDARGNEIFKKLSVDTLFADLGVKFSIESKGYVGISGYGFKFKPLPPKENSVCVWEKSGSRFKGVMQIEFCMPGSPSVAAGVREFGLFLARATHSRDFIVEMYNAEGHLLAAVEATDAQCVFSAARSNELIARARVLSNPYLHRVDRKVDEDYAIDNVVFSKPERLHITPASDKEKAVVLRNGDRHSIKNIKLVDNKILVSSAQLEMEFEVELNSVMEIKTGAKLVNRSDDWLAMLADRSLVRVDTGESLNSVQFGQQSVATESLTALSPTRNILRHPQSDDFEKAKTVLVFPTCRIASDDVRFLAESIEWGKDAELIEQPLITGKEPIGDDSPVPQKNEVSYLEPIPSDMPSIWFKKASMPTANSGSIHLTDGQQFTLGGEAGFELAGVDSNGVKVKWQGVIEEFSWKQIRAIKFQRN